MKTVTLVFTSAMCIFAATQVLADRAPEPDERAAIETALEAKGFTTWEEIEWDNDGHWEIDDAVDTEGIEWDLKMDADLNIIERDD